MDKRVVISTDSVCDLPPQFIREHNIPVMPLIINMGDASVEDGEGVAEQIYAFADKTHQTPKTAARNADEYREFFTKHKPKDGALIHFTISSEISVCYQEAAAAAKEMADVYVIDPRSLSTGVGLLIIKAIESAKSGAPAEKIVAEIKAQIPEIQCSFLTGSLIYLHRGGRCSGTSRFMATILGIHPQIVMTDGKMVPGKKYVGQFSKCLKKYANDILTEYNNPDLDYCFITHSRMDDPKIVEEITAQVAAKYKFKNIVETIAGGTITSHCGPNTLGVLYRNITEPK